MASRAGDHHRRLARLKTAQALNDGNADDLMPLLTDFISHLSQFRLSHCLIGFVFKPLSLMRLAAFGPGPDHAREDTGRAGRRRHQSIQDRVKVQWILGDLQPRRLLFFRAAADRRKESHFIAFFKGVGLFGKFLINCDHSRIKQRLQLRVARNGGLF